VSVEEVTQRNQRQHVHVLPRLAGRRLARMQREGVPDRPKLRDVGQRERLIAEGERRNVVPAGEVLGAHEGEAAGHEHAFDLGGEVIDALHVLDHLIRVHDVERPIGERPRRIEVAGPDVEAARARKLSALLDDLHPVDLLGVDVQRAA
jgi:hypothetical protein